MKRVTIAIVFSLFMTWWVYSDSVTRQQVVAVENPESTPKDLAVRIRGTWEQTSRTVKGKELSDPPGVFLVVTEDGMMQQHVLNGSTWESGTTIVQNVFFRVDPSANPATIDSTGKRDWSELRKGICKLENDTLTLCSGKANDARPTQFATGVAPGMGSVLTVYKRVARRR